MWYNVFIWRMLLVILVLFVSFASLLFMWGGFGVLLALPALFIGFCGPSGCALIMILGPLSGYVFVSIFRDSLAREVAIIDSVGEEAALWVSSDVSTFSSHPLKLVMREVIWMGHDESGIWLQAWAHTLKLPIELQDMVGRGAAQFGSILWSRLVLWLHAGMTEWPSAAFSCFAIWRIAKQAKTLGVWWYTKFWWRLVTVLIFLYHLPPDVMVPLLFRGCYWLLREIVAITHQRKEAWEWLQTFYVAILVKFIAWAESVNSEFEKHHSLAIARGSSRLTQHFKSMVMTASIVVSDLALPSYVRTKGPLSPDRETLEASLTLMKDLGWPINVNVTDPTPLASQSFREWVLCGSDFKQGIHNLKMQIDEDLESLRIAGIRYRRSEEYASVENELEATSRYFRSPKYDYPDLDLDDVWFVLGDIFRHSRLTSFNYIIRMWEKKYALGAFMRDPLRLRSKYKRSKFIHDLGGYGPFKALWARTFWAATQILPVSAVSVKGEALPEKKWANNMVRSIIGSPITQYILSTIWNYGPNHRFSWVSTPIKIGMPLNGYWMSTIWQRHSRCQIHVEGDFTAFDSTISGKVVDVIKAIRKHGFEHHKDRDRIADLIDINYEQVVHQLLNTTSTGNVYKKGTGLTTGHSSTSMDNSVGLVVLYLMAWKDLTGLSSREFMYYNELSCFGDDHVLSILAAKPAVWTPKNIRSTMAKWGLTNNLEVKQSLNEVSFLSKWGRRATPAERAELKKFGLDVPFVVWHDKKKLVGKLTAPVKTVSATYKAKRLLSYLTLTAHHPDLYDGICKVLVKSPAIMTHIRHNKWRIPSYQTVMRNWYNPSPPPNQNDKLVLEDQAEFENIGQLIEYGEVSALDAFVGALSMAPDLLSPLLFNYGYMRALQTFLRSRLAWVPDLLCLNNSILSAGMLENVCSRTPYRFLETSLFVPGLSGVNESTLLLRHWLFCWYCSKRPKQRLGAWTNMIVAKFSNLQFLLNGRVMLESRQNELGLDLLIVCALLSLVSVPDWVSPLGKVTLPDLQLILDSVIHFFTVLIWQSVPPNFRETTPTLRTFDRSGGPIGVQAPTGTGKSTGFVQHLAMVAGHRFRKIVVVEPRSILVHGLVQFMSDNYGLDVSGATSGLKLDTSKRVLYVTPQALMGHLELLNPENLIVLDEAHLGEAFYDALRIIIRKAKLPSLWVSATLPEHLRAQCQLVLDIPIANLWTVGEQIVRCNIDGVSSVLAHYQDYCLNVANTLTPSQKGLFFVPTVKMAEFLAENCKHSSFALHSHSKLNARWESRAIFATPVADVGLTIPDVTLVVTPNFTTLSGNKLVALDRHTRAQRKGRTGRTSNGTFRLVTYDGPFEDLGVKSASSPDSIRELLLSGMPVALASVLGQENVIRAFGVEPPDESGEIEGILNDLEVFLANMRPVLLGAQAARETGDPSFGPPQILHPTGTGISSSYPQPESGIDEKILEMAASLLSAKATHGSEVNDNLLRQLDVMAGPVIRVGNLVRALLAGEKTDTLNPKNAIPTGSLEDVYALKGIYDILVHLDE